MVKGAWRGALKLSRLAALNLQARETKKATKRESCNKRNLGAAREADAPAQRTQSREPKRGVRNAGWAFHASRERERVT